MHKDYAPIVHIVMNIYLFKSMAIYSPEQAMGDWKWHKTIERKTTNQLVAP